MWKTCPLEKYSPLPEKREEEATHCECLTTRPKPANRVSSALCQAHQWLSCTRWSLLGYWKWREPFVSAHWLISALGRCCTWPTYIQVYDGWLAWTWMRESWAGGGERVARCWSTGVSPYLKMSCSRSPGTTHLNFSAPPAPDWHPRLNWVTTGNQIGKHVCDQINSFWAG